MFRRLAWLINLHVGGQVIRTTVEHPFYVAGQGWLGAGLLAKGDRIRDIDGQWIEVEEIHDNDEVATVYNMRVAEYHTYFVGDTAWGWAVWAHNTGCPLGSDGVGKDATRKVSALEKRAKGIHSTLGDVTQDKTTTSVLKGKLPSGRPVTLVSSSEYQLRRSQRIALKGNEIAVKGTGHAEIKNLKAAKELKLTEVEIAASRAICKKCARAIGRAKATPVSPLKDG